MSFIVTSIVLKAQSLLHQSCSKQYMQETTS